MTATVIQLRPIVNAQRQLQRAGLGPNARRAVIRRVLAEQRAGRSGNSVAGEIYAARLSGCIEPPDPAA